MLYIWYPKNRTDLNTFHEENDVIGSEELARVKEKLKQGKQDSYKSLINLLSRDSKTPIKRLQESYQDSYQEITALLSRDCRTPIKRLQDSYKSPIKILQDSY